jgi:hypothetical protein
MRSRPLVAFYEMLREQKLCGRSRTSKKSLVSVYRAVLCKEIIFWCGYVNWCVLRSNYYSVLEQLFSVITEVLEVGLFVVATISLSRRPVAATCTAQRMNAIRHIQTQLTCLPLASPARFCRSYVFDGRDATLRFSRKRRWSGNFQKHRPAGMLLASHHTGSARDYEKTVYDWLFISV